MIAYLESCHVGEFLTGTIADVRAKFPFSRSPAGIHEIVVPEEEHNPLPVGYADPTQTLPQPPPPLCIKDCQNPTCKTCAELAKWWALQRDTVDDLILHSNLHKCQQGVIGTNLSKPLPSGGKIKVGVSGCLRQDGSCSARFPRELHERTEVDPSDGSIVVKKLEPMINTIMPDLTYLLRCNTNVTSLLSGTAIKAVVAYVCDYITKPSLKMYHAFDAVKAVLNRNTVAIGQSSLSPENTRRLITQMVNSLTSKHQIGSPMASMYLLGYPDHYTNLQFRVCWWRSYVAVVRLDWPEQPQTVEVVLDADGSMVDVVNDETHRAILMKSTKSYVGETSVDDYTHRPKIYERCTLFDYLQISTRCKRTAADLAEFEASVAVLKALVAQLPRGPRFDSGFSHFLQQAAGDAAETLEAEDEGGDAWLVKDLPADAGIEVPDDVSSYAFEKGHPLWRSHFVKCDRTKLQTVVPNFVGGSLPRKDQGNRETYCCTMLTFFKPWHRGADLKSVQDSWHKAFEDYSFTDKAERLMRNFNLRYECNDARDDFASQDRQRKRSLPLFSGQDIDHSGTGDLGGEFGETDFSSFFDQISDIKGRKQLAFEAKMQVIANVLTSCGWVTQFPNAVSSAKVVPTQQLSGSQWQARQKQLKEEIFAHKFRQAPPTLRSVPKILHSQVPVPDGVRILPPQYFTKEFQASD
ncbi:hypothetical protein B0H12DRAFT_1031258 [Mycena haematopus]|nr:hypothetical protein B0H12DRAFT_1031258 [Mycena haematopus]